jgi:hypothetical protein
MLGGPGDLKNLNVIQRNLTLKKSASIYLALVST